MRTRLLPPGVTPAMFVEVWQAAPHVGAVARALGMEPRLASQYAGYLRKKGVALKTMIRSEAALELGQLRALAATTPATKPAR